MKTRRAILVIAFCSAIAALAWAAMHLSTDTDQPLRTSPPPAVGPSLSVASNQSQPPSSPGTLIGEPSAGEAAAFADEIFITLRDKLPPLPADVAERMSSYRAELSVLPENPKSEAWRVGLLGQLDYLEYAVISGFQTERPEDKFREQLRAFKTGRDPYQLQSDSYVRGYVSPVDGTIAHYAVTLPPGYISTERYPLLISLHHHGWTDWFRPFQGCPAPQVEGAICVSPHGRGSADYMWIALDETVAAIEDAIANYPVDPNRVYITGYSMGGTGSWNLAVHSPHLFAAIAPVAGNADFTAWVKRWNWRLESDSPFSFLRKYLRESTCPAAYAENLVNMPVLCYHGEGDTIVPVEHARGMTGRLKQLGYKNVDYRESVGGHFSVSITEIWPWLAGYTRNRFPSKVVCKTATLSENRAYYLEILERQSPDGYAQVSIDWGNQLKIDTTNASAFSIRYEMGMSIALPFPDQGYATIDGKQVNCGTPPTETSLLYFEKGAAEEWVARWDPSEKILLPTMRKRPRIEGPIEDAFRRPFILVYGTGESDQALADCSKVQAERFARNWARRYVKSCAIKADRELSAADISNNNLVLYGAPWVNSIYSRIADQLPILVTRNGVSLKGDTEKGDYSGNDIGVRFVYPNPLAPNRYVVVNASSTVAGLEGIDFRFENWFDWIPYDNRSWYDFCIFDNRTVSPETFLESGLFDRFWAFRPELRWKGLSSERNLVKPRRTPARTAAQTDTAFLDDLRPIFVETLKGDYNAGRSWSGGALSAFGQVFERGIGTRIESCLSFYTGGQYRTFNATIGIDYEGVPMAEVSAARKDVENVRFIVAGDGRILLDLPYVDCRSVPRDISVDIAGVRYLSLLVRRMSPEGWLYGSVCWGDARVTK